MNNNSCPAAVAFGSPFLFFTRIAIVMVLVLLHGCATVVQRNPVPEQAVGQAQVPGIPDARFWGDEIPPNVLDMVEESVARQAAAGLLYDASGHSKPANYLALSGGGADGAFGAGLLNGWTDAGTRPQFVIVTGTSTGALIAPFAYMGPQYDQQLKEFYTTISTRDILKPKRMFNIFGADSVSDISPLKALLEKYIDEKFLQGIAKEYAKGRLLLIGTTNLDAQRPVIWSMGKIASSNHPDAAKLFRNIMIASASIGGAFPPVYLEVEVDGKRYDEMHVDGGTTSQVFLYPAALDLRTLSKQIGLRRDRSVYVIRNARIRPEWDAVTPRLVRIAERSISTLIKTQGIGDLYRIFLGAKRDKIDYYVAYISDDFEESSEEPFDQAYMRKLFDYAYSLAKDGYPWLKAPPGFEPPPAN